MRVLVALEDRFLKTSDGNIYSNTITDYNFWARYLQVYEEVIVLARVRDKQDNDKLGVQSNGPNVRFIEVPYFVGPVEFIKKYFRIRKVIYKALDEADTFILRTPGTLASLLYGYLIKRGIPYGVEVVGDPWDSLAPGSVKSIIRPLIRRKAYRSMVLQCHHASVASYVTEHSLQKRYPPGCWTTYYSSINMPEDAYIDESEIQKRHEIITQKSKSTNNESWRICHVGMMEHLYKAQDILINAVANCIKSGLKLEVLFIGDGRFKKQLQMQAERCGISNKITFLGKMEPGQPVIAELDKSDLYVLPSRQEGLPRTIIEAMARGLPCIASDVGGIPELLEKEDMVSADSVVQLTDKITSVISSSERMKLMSCRNYRKSQNYRINVLNPRRIEYYRKLIEYTLDREI